MALQFARLFSCCSVGEVATRAQEVMAIPSVRAGSPDPESDPNMECTPDAEKKTFLSSEGIPDVEKSTVSSEGNPDVEQSFPVSEGIPDVEDSPPQFTGPPKLLGDDWFMDAPTEVIAPTTKSHHVSHHEFRHSRQNDHNDHNDREESIVRAGNSKRSDNRKNTLHGSTVRPSDSKRSDNRKNTGNRSHSSSTKKNEEIPIDALGPPLSVMDDSLPDWRWEVRDNKWSSYTRHDAINLERFWRYYAKNESKGSKTPYIARLELAGKEAIIDFQNLTIQVNGGRARSLFRRQLPDTWLTNSWFFDAFVNSLGNQANRLGAELNNLFDTRFNEDLRDIDVTSPECDGIETAQRIYLPPFGWKRFAANVHGKYNESLQWYQKRGAGAWAVAYHALKLDNLPDILFTGFAGQTETETTGMDATSFSCTPLLEVAEQDADTMLGGDHDVQMILQLRVRPTAVQIETRRNPYWLIKNPNDVRIYGVLVREAPKAPAGLAGKVAKLCGGSAKRGSVAAG